MGMGGMCRKHTRQYFEQGRGSQWLPLGDGRISGLEVSTPSSVRSGPVASMGGQGG